MTVGLILVVSGTLSAALVGLLAGLAFQWTPTTGIGVLLGLALVAVIADAVQVRTGHLTPLSIGRQVPVEWGRLFDPRVVAALYGARLGVGPLTMLSTWLWWAATLGAAFVGVAESVIVAVTFGLVRSLVTVFASQRAERAGHAPWFGRLRRNTTRAWLSLDGAAVGLLLVVLLVATACTSNTSIEAGPDGVADETTTSAGPAPTATSEGDDGVPEDDTTPTSPTTQILTESSLSETSAPLVTSPDDVEPRAPAGADALAALLIDDLDGFEAVTASGADRPLSISEASALQPDPTEELPLLETRGYQGGWTRAFRNDDNDVIVATVYDFISALEADFYLEDGTITLIGDGGTIYEVEAMPGARGFRQDVAGADGPLVVYGITFTEGNKWFLVTVVGDPSTATPARLLPAAVAQHDAARAASASD